MKFELKAGMTKLTWARCTGWRGEEQRGVSLKQEWGTPEVLGRDSQAPEAEETPFLGLCPLRLLSQGQLFNLGHSPPTPTQVLGTLCALAAFWVSLLENQGHRGPA